MARAGFSLRVNPYGIIFDPLSLVRMLEEVISGNAYCQEDLFLFAQRWYSLRHHGSFSSADSGELLDRINAEIREAHRELKQARVLFVTFGTAEAYFHEESGIHAANCHKLPQAQFREILLDHARIAEAWQRFMPELKKFNPDIQLVFTVSPVRYLRLGAVRNQLSKSHLLLAAQEICTNCPDCSYFPSYEIMMDDLRDYRFYASDRSHPSEEASEYIWLRLMRSMASDTLIETALSVRRDLRILDHRPSDAVAFRAEADRVLEKVSAKLSAAGHPNPRELQQLIS